MLSENLRVRIDINLTTLPFRAKLQGEPPLQTTKLLVLLNAPFGEVGKGVR